MTITQVLRRKYFPKANIIQTGAFYIVQLQIIYLLNLQYNVLLTCGSSAIAKSLVLMLVS